MCGICGIVKFNHQPADESKIRTMMVRMKHRGPDDEGVFIDGNVGLGFVRLSILDLSPLGHQPMFDDTGRYVIIHNGEVYNFIEIREELVKKGYSFKSNTDTEVILKSYIEWGKSCLDKFNGMWAFCIYDQHTKQIFISRDRYGVKPFYYYLDDEQFIFASEIPPILDVLKNKPKPNNQVIFDYLVFNRTDQTESTFFEEIKKLQHGHIFKIRENNISISKWYDLRRKVEQSEGFQDSNEYRELFSSAIGLRLRSDVPVGVCLSGGLDSSSIVSVLLKDFNKSDLNTFSAVYDKESYGDESEFIDEYKSNLQNMFFIHPSAETLYADMRNFVRAHGEPVPATGPYAQFKVMELAKGNVVVTLDGQGADESLAGYHYFYGIFFKELWKANKFLTLMKELLHYLYLHKSVYAFKTFLFFLMSAKNRTMLRVREKNYLNEEFVRNYSLQNKISDNLYASLSLKDGLIDHFEYKLEHLLKWEDRNSMYFSLESRVPFLDYRLVEKTLASNSENFIRDGWTKHILRESMRGILPEKIRKRKDKIGFGTPQAEWFRSENFISLINEILSNGHVVKNDIIDKEKFGKVLQQHTSRKADHSKEIWKLMNLELWFEEFLVK